MSRNFFGKKILTSLLAVIMLVSLMTVPAMAHVPAEYDVVDGKYIANDFEAEENPLAGIIKTHGKFEHSIEKAHSGEYSIKATGDASGAPRFELDPSKFLNSEFGFEANKKYYVSFWTYTPDGTDFVNNFGGSWTPYADANIANSFKYSATKEEQWNKRWITFETSPVENEAWSNLTICFHGVASGHSVYVDDFEIVEITDASATTNVVPSSATVVKQGYMNGDTVANQGYDCFGAEELKKAAITYDNAYFGHTAYKIESGTASAALNGRSVLCADKILADTAWDLYDGDWYYASFYIYISGDDADISLTTRQNQKIITTRTIPADKWVKLSGMVQIKKSGLYWLWDVHFSNTDATVAYIDDIVLARLSGEPAAASLEVSDVDVNKLGAGSLTLTSTIELDEASLSTSAFTFSGNGAVTDVTLNDTKTEAYVSFEHGNSDSDTLAVSLKDVYDRAVSDSFVVNNNATALRTLNSDTSFEGKQYKRVLSTNTVGVSGGTDGRLFYSSDEAHSGNVSVAMPYNSNEGNRWFYWNECGYPSTVDYTFENGNKYYYEFYAKISDDAETETCTLTTAMNRESKAGTTSVNINKEWTKVRHVVDFSEVNVPALQEIVIGLTGALNDGDIVYMDDFKIYQIPEGQEYAGNFHVADGDVVTTGDKAETNLTLTNTYFDKETIPVRVILATYAGDTLVDADVVDKNLGFGDIADIKLSADKGETSKIFVWKWPDLTPLCK